MTAIILDHVVAVLTIAAWFATGVTLALRRTRVALALFGAAVLVTLARVATVVVLAGRGWWFVQEKVLLGLPLLGVAGAAAVLIAGRWLLAARRGHDESRPARVVVSVLTTAYAALAGFVVTFLIGYPLTTSTALIAVALVFIAGLVTARVVATPVAVDASRRRFLGLAGGAVVLGAAGVGLSFVPASSVTTGGGPGRSSRTAVSVDQLRGSGSPAPGGRHTLTARSSRIRLPSGRDIDAWTFNGTAPGPAITATQGDFLEVTLRNADIEDGVTLHWHGYDLPCGEDGVPGVTQHAVAPGQEFVYRFRADQVGTYWYHTHYASHIGVRKGLYGTLVVKPRETEPVDLTLPIHTFDGTVVLSDSSEHSVAPGTPVRLRLINTDSEPHQLALTGTPFRLSAVDGRDLNQPGEVDRAALHLAAGGRYDLIFTQPSTSVDLVVDNDHALRLRPDSGSDGEPTSADTSSWPELDLLRYGVGAAIPFDPDNPDRHFTMVLDRGVAMVNGRPTYAHTINGRGHPSIPDQLVTEGDIVRFTIVNRSLETHPWHLHGHPVLILSRNETSSTGSPLWMDTFDVRPGERWEVAFRANNPGIWMNHCHNLPHADQGMMQRLVYDGVTTPFAGHAH